ncbi:hypothetical protein CDAR_577841 [Caerostris darwini]|uniref:Uncharacterized protein n=1 Tax=Caerostris darwini TaxID=1538125 RepID=A0AAV4RHQ8_9ARAC|nr:hypothetical protein CDAR_577841 [Caerostris darwini]
MVNGIAVSLSSPTHTAMRIDGGSVFVLVWIWRRLKSACWKPPRRMAWARRLFSGCTEYGKRHSLLMLSVDSLREVTPAKTSSLTEATFSVLLPSFKDNLLDTPFPFLPPSDLAATATSPPGDSATVFWEPPPGRK